MKFSILFTAMAIAMGMSACQKKSDIVATAQDVIIDIKSPIAQQNYKSGDTLYINAYIISPGQLHGYEVQVIDTASGFIVYDAVAHTHTDKFEIHNKWVTAAKQPICYKLTIQASVSHDGDVATKELFINVAP